MLNWGGFPGGSNGKKPASNVEELGSITGSGRSPGEGNGNPLQYSCWEFQGQRSLTGYSPWVLKDLDMTEQLTYTHTHTHIHTHTHMHTHTINWFQSLCREAKDPA